MKAFEFTAEVNPFYTEGVKVLVLTDTGEIHQQAGIAVESETETNLSLFVTGQVIAGKKETAKQQIKNFLQLYLEDQNSH